MNERPLTLIRNESCDWKYIGTLTGEMLDVDIVESNGCYKAIMYDPELGIRCCVDNMPLADGDIRHSLDEFVETVNGKFDEHVDYYLKIIAIYYHDIIFPLY